MTLKQLEAFYWAATCGSFAIAANRLHLSQSSLSKRISELEESLACSLFDRSGHRAVLTAAGVDLLPKAHNMISTAEDLVATVGKDKGLRGRCRFGTGEIAASSWLPTFVANVKRKFPELSLELHVELGRLLEQKLIDGELDFAIIANTPTHPIIEHELIARVEFSWIVSADIDIPEADPLAKLTEQLPIINMNEEASTNLVIRGWKSAVERQNVKFLNCNNMSAIAGLVAAGMGISYVPTGWISPLVEKNIVQPILETEPLPTLDYYFHWRSDDHRSLIRTMKEMTLKEANYSSPVLML